MKNANNIKAVKRGGKMPTVRCRWDRVLLKMDYK
jgi:hypothetical protein